MASNDIIVSEIQAEIERTIWQDNPDQPSPSIHDTHEHEGRLFVYVCDMNVCWWHAADELLTKLNAMPGACEPEDESEAADDYARWCDATQTATMYDGSTGSFPEAPWEREAA